MCSSCIVEHTFDVRACMCGSGSFLSRSHLALHPKISLNPVTFQIHNQMLPKQFIENDGRERFVHTPCFKNLVCHRSAICLRLGQRRKALWGMRGYCPDLGCSHLSKMNMRSVVNSEHSKAVVRGSPGTPRTWIGDERIRILSASLKYNKV